MSYEMNALVGAKVASVLMNAERDGLAFVTDKGRICFVAHGDCCSESWFNHVTNLDALLGHTVRRVEDRPERTLIDQGQAGHSGRQEYDRLYGLDLHTEAGTCTIELRNSSNGYYGGWIEVRAGAHAEAEDAAAGPLIADF